MPPEFDVGKSMKHAKIMMAAGIAVCLAAAAQAASTRHRVARVPKTPAAAQSYEARYRACRAEAFRRFGWHYGTRLVLYTDFVVAQADFCMRNGGHY
jgi:hypothetical protein